MKPTTVLSEEHRVIEVVLSCLEQMAQEAIDNGRLDAEPAGQVVDFIRNFADKCHHGKEEDHLFTALADKGMSPSEGPVAVMLNEHDQGRALVKAMADSIAAASDGEMQALGLFVTSARNFVLLLRNHIHKEDRILFPIAERMLSDDEMNQLNETFNTVESEHMGTGTHQRYIDLARDLAQRYAVATTSLPAHTTCCGH